MNRVVITGIGIINCLGHHPDQVVHALQNGISGIIAVPERREMGFNSCLAGTVKNFQPPEVPKKLARQIGHGGLLALTAARQAFQNAQCDENLIRNDRTGIIVGNSGNMHDIYQNCYTKKNLGKKLTGMALPRTMASSVSANLSVIFGTRGHTLTISSACASGATAIGLGAHLIRTGLQDRVLAGGVQEGSWEYDCNFDALRVFSRREDQPDKASRPFDKFRDGLVPAAGAGFVLLESRELAQKRNSPAWAELIGFASNSDGHEMTTPSGSGSTNCMKLALKDAAISPDLIDYINAHATATPVGDIVEAQGIRDVFGENTPVSSTKSMTGHEIGAAGSNELIYTMLMMKHRFIAPNINIEQIDEQCGPINLIANQAVNADIRIAMSNSFGFGGVNTCLIVRKV